MKHVALTKQVACRAVTPNHRSKNNCPHPPTAVQGRGRGNAFLNDLTDADVLIHVVDGSGRSDRDGQILVEGNEQGGPLDDIGWVRASLAAADFDLCGDTRDDGGRRGQALTEGCERGRQADSWKCATNWNHLLQGAGEPNLVCLLMQ